MLLRIVDRLFIVLGAFLLALFPSFVYQYQHQLIGHVDELNWQVHRMERTATKSGKKLDPFIQKFIDHADPDVSQQGYTMQEVVNRNNKFSAALNKLQNASLFTRPFVFVSSLYWDIFKSTAKNFQPSLSLNLEGSLYALLGMACGYLCFLPLASLWKKNKMFTLSSHNFINTEK